MSDKPKYQWTNGLESVDLPDADGIRIKLPSGGEIELAYRKSDGLVTLHTSGQLTITPVAGNCIRVATDR